MQQVTISKTGIWVKGALNDSVTSWERYRSFHRTRQKSPNVSRFFDVDFNCKLSWLKDFWVLAPWQYSEPYILACTRRKTWAQWRFHVLHIDKACLWGLSKDKNNKGFFSFSIFGVGPGSWWIELKWPEGAIVSWLFCLPLRVSRWRLLIRCRFQISPSPRWVLRWVWLGLTTLGWISKRGICTGAPEGKGEKKNNSDTK